MHGNYIVEFTITRADDSNDAHKQLEDRVLSLLGNWISQKTETLVTANDLRSSGEREIIPQGKTVRATASWKYAAGAHTWATQVTRRDAWSDGSAVVSVTTVAPGGGGIVLRLELGRTAPRGQIAPLESATMKQPGLVTQLVSDEQLKVTSRGQIQDGRHLPIRSFYQVEALVEALRQQNRLPVLVMHVRTKEADRASTAISRGLVGLVRVVTVDYRASRTLARMIPEVDVPFESALLVWPQLSTPPVIIGADLTNTSDRDMLRANLMCRLAPLSVLSGGTNALWRTAEVDARRLEASQAAKKSAHAAATGDKNAEIAALREQVQKSDARAEDAETHWLQTEMERTELADQISNLKSKAQSLQAKSDALQFALNGKRGGSFAEEPTFDNVPETLVAGDTSSLQIICEHLEQASEHTIAFTEDALAAWSKAGKYPTPLYVREQLILLARVARGMYGKNAEDVGRPDWWAKETYGINIATSDDEKAMPKNWSRTFSWQGRTLKRIPHVRLETGYVSPEHCARIYFDWDGEGQQIVVDHVGLHWTKHIP